MDGLWNNVSLYHVGLWVFFFFFYTSECVRERTTTALHKGFLVQSWPAQCLCHCEFLAKHFCSSQFEIKLYIKYSEGDIWKFSWMVCPSPLCPFTLPFEYEDHALILRILLRKFHCGPWCTSRDSIRNLDTVVPLSQWPLTVLQLKIPLQPLERHYKIKKSVKLLTGHLNL